jgi:hypothetical protein
LKEWYAVVHNQWKGKEINCTINAAINQAKELINDIDHLEKEIKNNITHTARINAVCFASEPITKTIGGNEAAWWKEALTITKKAQSLNGI